jgi:hypothetical protein
MRGYTQAADIPESLEWIWIWRKCTSTRPSDTPVIQIPIQSRPILPPGLRILVLSRFRYRVDPSCSKAFGYSCYPDSDTVDPSWRARATSNVRGKCLYYFGKKKMLCLIEDTVGIIFVKSTRKYGHVGKCSSRPTCPSNVNYIVPVCGTPREYCVRIDMVEFIWCNYDKVIQSHHEWGPDFACSGWRCYHR